MSYPLVRDLAAEGIPVRLTCGVLGHSRQPYYAWLSEQLRRRRHLRSPADLAPVIQQTRPRRPGRSGLLRRAPSALAQGTFAPLLQLRPGGAEP
jgi:hypothetical protein